MMQPWIQDITEPVLAVDLGKASMRALLYIPGMRPEEQYVFVLPSPEFALAERLRRNTALRRPVFLHGDNISGSVVSAMRAHLAQGLPLCLHTAYAARLAATESALLQAGMTVSASAPPETVSIRIGDFDPAFWKTLLDMAGLPQPGAILVAAMEYGRVLEGDSRPDRSALLQQLFDEAPGQGVDLRSQAGANQNPAMLRLCALQRMTGFPVLDSAFAFVFGMLGMPAVAGRSRREGVTLAFLDKHLLRVALVYRDRLHALLEMPASALTAPDGNMDLALLGSKLDDFRLGWLPAEDALSRGGFLCRASSLPPEAEGFRPLFVAGPEGARLTGMGQMLGSVEDRAMNNCWGLLYAFGAMQRAGEESPAFSPAG